MRITKLRIKNFYGIKELELDGKDVELTGTNGAGKSSVIDSIRTALTNKSNRPYILRNGESEGEIYVETDTGLVINRKKRTDQADYKSVKNGSEVITSPESFLSTLFTPLQLNPVSFIQMSEKEQNQAILDLVEFAWDIPWIISQFGEVPRDVDYDQNILQVLHDIQSENGYYFKHRQDINRDIKSKTAQAEGLASGIPARFDAAHWESFDLSAKYRELAEGQKTNDEISRAKMFHDSYNDKVRGIDGKREIAVSALRSESESERNNLNSLISRLKAEIVAAKEKLAGLDARLNERIAVVDAQREAEIAKLDKDMGVASDYMSRTPVDTKSIQSDIDIAEEMKKKLYDYNRMAALQDEVKMLTAESDELTAKIERARELPGVILETAKLPVEGLTVVDGVPLVNGLPIRNLSEGEMLDLCVDVALSKPNGIQLILIDGAEKLSEINRQHLYEKCKEKGVQVIASRTTDDPDLLVTAL